MSLPTIHCDNCGQDYTPACVGEVIAHEEGKCPPAPQTKPWHGQKTKEMWKKLCAVERENTSLRQRLSEATGRPEVSGTQKGTKAG